jgi:hypothetical protein
MCFYLSIPLPVTCPPVMYLLKGFWSIIKNVTVIDISVSEANAEDVYPVGSEAIKKPRALVDVLVEEFTLIGRTR